MEFTKSEITETETEDRNISRPAAIHTPNRVARDDFALTPVSNFEGDKIDEN